MEKFTDLYEDFDTDINHISDWDFIKVVKINKLEERNTKDIFKKWKKTKWKKYSWDINLLWRKFVKVLKNKTKNFDSFIRNKKLKDINLIKNYKLIEIFSKILKKENIFKEKIFFRKSFFNKIIIVFLWVFLFYLIDGILIQVFVRSWYNNIISIVNSTNDFNKIKSLSSKAKNDFIISDFLFKPFLLIPNHNISDIYYIIKWWKTISFLLYDFTKYNIKISNNLEGEQLHNVYLTNLLKNSKNNLENFSNWLYNSLNYYNKVWNLSNANFQDNFDYIKKQLLFWYNFINTINRNFEIFLNIFWDTEEKRYLILLQNNDEIRPTWGFIWSLWIITIYKWQIKDFKKSDIYEYEWEINKVYENKIIAPIWINKISTNLWLRDANFEIDFNESSSNIKLFTDKIDKDIDWIIYINQNIVLDLLKEVWDINFEKIWAIINEDNFSQILSTLVEAKTFKVWTLSSPKKILFDFTDIFIDILKEKKLYMKYMKILYEHIISRDIVITSFHSQDNSLLWKLWLDWTINYSKTLDFSYPVYTSIWWWKTDRYMDRKYIKTININADCSIDTTLNISQTHTFTQALENDQIKLMNKYNINDNNILFIQWKAENKQFIQVVLPKNSIINKKEFFDIREKNNTKIIQFYTTTRRLESINHTIEYSLPNPECTPYDFKFYKQPWIRYYDLNIKLNNNEEKNIWLKNDFYYKKNNH